MQNKSQNNSQAQQLKKVTNIADKTMGPRAAWPHTHNGADGKFKPKPE